jgi:indole-3-glycerol phosphate synthase
MSNGAFLDTMLENKRTEVAARRSALPFRDLQIAARSQPPTRGFMRALRERVRPGPVALIAEIKKASPSAGVIREDFAPVAIARAYEANGASCISVLTDERFFQGLDSHLGLVRKAVSLPLLRKDFTIDAYQIYEARLLGADAVLLIAAALSFSEVRDFLAIGAEIGLDVLVEVHTEDEMESVVDADAKLIGINSRNLKTFITDLSVVERLAPMAPAGTTLVAESGIKSPTDVARVAAAGAHAILVGESLMRETDIGAAVRALLS